MVSKSPFIELQYPAYFIQQTLHKFFLNLILFSNSCVSNNWKMINYTIAAVFILPCSDKQFLSYLKSLTQLKQKKKSIVSRVVLMICCNHLVMGNHDVTTLPVGRSCALLTVQNFPKLKVTNLRMHKQSSVGTTPAPLAPAILLLKLPMS